MHNFKVGDLVYAQDWCCGEIMDIEDDIAYVGFETSGGGGSLPFHISDLELIKKYVLKISYSWGDEEPTLTFKDKIDAWEHAKKLAVDEALLCSIEHECEIGLRVDEENYMIILHYTYDDEYCYYKIEECE